MRAPLAPTHTLKWRSHPHTQVVPEHNSTTELCTSAPEHAAEAEDHYENRDKEDVTKRPQIDTPVKSCSADRMPVQRDNIMGARQGGTERMEEDKDKVSLFEVQGPDMTESEEPMHAEEATIEKPATEDMLREGADQNATTAGCEGTASDAAKGEKRGENYKKASQVRKGRMCTTPRCPNPNSLNQQSSVWWCKLCDRLRRNQNHNEATVTAYAAMGEERNGKHKEAMATTQAAEAEQGNEKAAMEPMHDAEATREEAVSKDVLRNSAHQTVTTDMSEGTPSGKRQRPTTMQVWHLTVSCSSRACSPL